jgi:EVE domain-containing protein
MLGRGPTHRAANGWPHQPAGGNRRPSGISTHLNAGCLVGRNGAVPVGELTDSQQAWLFQSNPDYYDLDRALRELAEIEWAVRGHIGAVHAGDRAYVWRAGRQAGVVAIGTVMAEPAESGPNPAERPYWRQPERYGFDNVEPRIRVSIDRIVEPPLLKTREQKSGCFQPLPRGCGAGIRTPTSWSRARRPAVRRPRNG